jgi:hypothetical protein
VFLPPDDRLAVTVVFGAGAGLPLFAVRRSRGTITPRAGKGGTVDRRVRRAEGPRGLRGVAAWRRLCLGACGASCLR